MDLGGHPKTGQSGPLQNRPIVDRYLGHYSGREGRYPPASPMSNVLSEEKKLQIIALGRLGWSLRRIERETEARRGNDLCLFEGGRSRPVASPRRHLPSKPPVGLRAAPRLPSSK